jgi:hypothetical protein
MSRRYSNYQSREVKGNMATIQEKLAHLDTIKQRVESFVQQGGDLKSASAVPLGVEFVNAFSDVAIELGYQPFKPTKNNRDFMRPDPAS